MPLDREPQGGAEILEPATLSRPATADAPLGRAEAFLALVNGDLDRVYRRAAVLLGDRFEAEDAVHDAAERAWRSWGSLRDPTQFRAWFDRILVNVCRDRLRRRRRVASIEVAPDPAPDVPDGMSQRHVDRAADRAVVLDALAALSADERIVVVLRFDVDLTVPEISRLTGTREGTVKSRLHSALRKLRATLGDRWEKS